MENIDKKMMEEPIANVKCFACNKKIKIDYSHIPSNEKTFYWRCPECNAELKIGNPKYISKEKKEYQEILMDRAKLIKTMQLPSNIRKLSQEEQNEIIRKTIMNVNEMLKNIYCDSFDYELSRRQKITRDNAIKNINQKEFLEAYYEIIDFADDYGDKHNGKIFEIEKQEILHLINNLYEII